MNVLQTIIEELERDRSLSEPNRLRYRIGALDRLEPYLTDLQDQACSDSTMETALHHRAKRLQVKLESDNQRLYRDLRRNIQRASEPFWLSQWLSGLPVIEQVIECNDAECYDYLDDLVSGVLQLQEPDAAVAERTNEMVFYQPTPARHIFDLIDRLGLTEDDILVDLGSGLGHVPLLISICTPAKTIGIEFQAAYIRCAEQSASALNLTRALFVQQDARRADFSVGTVFYLYTPFHGTVLRAVLDSLQSEASRREIRVCAFGPCIATIAQEPWLAAVGAVETHRIAVFRSGI